MSSLPESLRAMILRCSLLALGYAVTVLLPCGASAVSISVGAAAGTAGTLVSVSVSLATADAAIAGIQNDLTFDAVIIAPNVVNGKPDCQPDPDVGKNLGVTLANSAEIRVLLFSIFDISPIPSGVLYTCRFRIAPSAPPGVYPIIITNLIASNPSGQPLPDVIGVNGAVTVAETPPVAIAIGSAMGMAGDSVTIAISMATNGHLVGGIENDISFDAATLSVLMADGTPNCRINPALGKQLAAHLVDDGTVRFLVLSFDNLSSTPDGILYTCTFSILPEAIPGKYALASAHVVVADPEGHAVASVGRDGSIIVNESPCAGDCNGDAMVTIDELITSINIALGTGPLAACPAGDVDHDGTIVVSEILQAVGYAQAGCPF